ncbi:hypothetical protein HG536_0D05940 [Torulaspora globosa]|uniref:Importin N-terminal domain-containing protein n=1 Tax=Torulaspora globosa TaxID=48254 RepID=A0A7G3ZHT6_9SACH|nr:uncharacterized protein HG536_0D05940 [Torulaspora globosa]QLL33072.1 hypothetical protein HG536_0D05940 [Torulaspora globosa]
MGQDLMFDSSQLINGAQSSDDRVRRAAETQLVELCDRDASLVFLSMVGVALNPQDTLSSRQFALFALRKLITMYWSPGFESYRSCSNLKETAKDTTRESLLELCLSDEQSTKLRNAASYCVVQISAVDFPDQWPQLLSTVYDAILSRHSLAAISLLNEIYDDVMTEDMFFDEGIGLETVRIVIQIHNNPNSSLEARLAAFNLLHACLQQLLTVSSSSAAKRKEMAAHCGKEALKMWGEYLQSRSITDHPLNLPITGRVYEDLALLKNELPKKLVPEGLYLPFRELALADLQTAGKAYLSILQDFLPDYQLEEMNECAIHILEFLTAICHFQLNSTEVSAICDALGNLCCLDNESVASWLDDFNSYISVESGLTACFSTRDQACELLNSMDDENYNLVFEHILLKVSQLTDWKQNWKFQESLLFLLQSIAENESQPSDKIVNLTREAVAFLESMLCSDDAVSFVISRTMLVLPKMLGKFMEELEDIKVLTSHLLSKSLEIALSLNDNVIRASFLVAFTYYSNFAELSSVLNREVRMFSQKGLLNLISQLSENAEDDTDGVLMEVLNNVIECNLPEDADEEIVQAEFNLVLSISAKDPSNIQTVVESQECLEKLLEGVSRKDYEKYVETCLPSFLKIIEGHSHLKYAYSPLLSLVLQFLAIFMRKKPAHDHLPSLVCKYAFEPLKNLLLDAEDDEMMQLATEAFSYLVLNTEVAIVSTHLGSIVAVLDRLLSFDVSDVAAMHVGSLIVTIFTRFSTEIENMMPVILQAAANRLIQAKNISTTHNLLSVFCYLASVDAQQTVDFLYTMNVEGTGKNALQSIMSIWLESFELIKGERRTKENIVALIKIYLLNDARIAAMQVNDEIIPYEGDRIITRSMARQMPDRYTQVSVYTKIIKLFIAELNFQDKQADPERFIASRDNGTPEDNDGSDDDWEDVEDVLDYEKLQEYVDDDDQVDSGDTHGEFCIQLEGDYSDQSIREILLSFFKAAAANNTSDFRGIYNSLSESDKKILSENLV